MFLHNNGDSLHCCSYASFPLIRPELQQSESSRWMVSGGPCSLYAAWGLFMIKQAAIWAMSETIDGEKRLQHIFASLGWSVKSITGGLSRKLHKCNQLSLKKVLLQKVFFLDSVCLIWFGIVYCIMCTSWRVCTCHYHHLLTRALLKLQWSWELCVTSVFSGPFL